jgi:hypothetical protein
MTHEIGLFACARGRGIGIARCKTANQNTIDRSNEILIVTSEAQKPKREQECWLTLDDVIGDRMTRKFPYCTT